MTDRPEIQPALPLWQVHNAGENGQPGPVVLWRFEAGLASKAKRYEQAAVEWFTQEDVDDCLAAGSDYGAKGERYRALGTRPARLIRLAAKIAALLPPAAEVESGFAPLAKGGRKALPGEVADVYPTRDVDGPPST